MRSHKGPHRLKTLSNSLEFTRPQGLAIALPGSPSGAFGGVVQGILDLVPALLAPVEPMALELLL